MVWSSLLLLVELVALFFGVATAIALLERRVGPDRLRAWMGGRPLVAALKGIAVGFVTPFCTYSAIPMLIGLRRAGVPTAGYVAFLVAAPVLDPVLFGALIVIVGAPVALVYVLVAFSAALLLAMLAERVGIEHLLRADLAGEDLVSVQRPSAALCVAAPAAGPLGAASPVAVVSDRVACEPVRAPWRGWRAELPAAVRSATSLLRSMGALLVAGVAIGLAIEMLVSPGAVARAAGGTSTFSIPIAAALGTPLYFHTELFIPIADSLHSAGLGIGAIVALTIAGAGANVPEFVILSRLASKRLIAILFGYVFAVAVTGGVLAQSIAG